MVNLEEFDARQLSHLTLFIGYKEVSSHLPIYAPQFYESLVPQWIKFAPPVLSMITSKGQIPEENSTSVAFEKNGLFTKY